MAKFSYQEFSLKGYNYGRFPTSAVKDFTGELPETNLSPFENYTEEDLFSVLHDMKKRNIGYLCTLGYLLPNPLKKGKAYAKDVVEWLKSLYFATVDKINPKEVEIVIKSRLDDAFSTKIYAHAESLPQEAIDTVVRIVGKNGKMLTILANKKKSASIDILFSNGKIITLLETGKFGPTFIGEHLEKNEKPAIWSALAEVLSSGKPVKLSGVSLSVALRGLLEEAGIEPSMLEEAEFYLVGEDASDGRDDRYWLGEAYGYERKSRSAIVVANLTFKEGFDFSSLKPIDVKECIKPGLYDMDEVLQEFSPSGKIPCAFDSHPKMLTQALKEMEKLNL